MHSEVKIDYDTIITAQQIKELQKRNILLEKENLILFLSTLLTLIYILLHKWGAKSKKGFTFLSKCVMLKVRQLLYAPPKSALLGGSETAIYDKFYGDGADAGDL